MNKLILSILLIVLFNSSYCQNVGIGTTTPKTKLMVIAERSDPQIPDNISSAIFRIGISNNEGIDFGKMGAPSYASWIQSGVNGITADPLVLQPAGGLTAIGTTNPAPSAKLDITSTTQGFLPPRMTVDQRNAIFSPAQGLIIYCTNCGLSGGEPQFFNGTIWSNFMGVDATYEIGMNYQGGKLAYIRQLYDPGYIEGEVHGLIAAPTDQSGNAIRWYIGSYISTGATATMLGTGNANTNTIVSAQGTVANYAARLCADLVLNGYSDWYLPSKDELNILYLNRIKIGGFTYFNYWSSSERNQYSAWAQIFNNGYRIFDDKIVQYYVRAVRAF